MNFYTNGDVCTIRDDSYLGRIDSDGDWRPEDDCQLTEDMVRTELRRQIDEVDFNWPAECLRFAGI